MNLLAVLHTMENKKLVFVLLVSCCVFLSKTSARPSTEETDSSNPEDEYCVTSCRSKANGDYQSCEGCQVFIMCHEQQQLTVQCPPGLVWDDIDKSCVMMSKTCYSDDVSMIDILDDSNEIKKPDSVVSLPAFFNLRFTIEGTSMTLNLTKNENVHSMTPIFTAQNGRIKTMSPKQEEFGVYKDIATMASVIVKMKQDSKGKMTKQYEGLFRMDNEDYFIRPAPPLGSEQHAIVRRSLEGIKSGSKQHKRMKRTMEQISSGKSYIVRKMSHDSEEMGFDNMELRPEIANLTLLQEKVMQSAKDSNSLPSAFQRYRVDVIIFLDYAVYDKWYRLSQKSTPWEKEAEAIQNIRFYYTHVMNGVDLRYNSIEDSRLEINMNLRGIFVAMTGTDSPWTHYNRPDDYYHTEAEYALTDFELWLSSAGSFRGSFLPSFDLAALFSGYKLYRGRKKDGSLFTIGGLAHIKGACQYTPRWLGASINYDSGLYAATQTVTHEMGHNLGSFHDGNIMHAASCTGRDRYIMAVAPGVLDDTTYTNAFKFSPCSIKSIREYLLFLTMEDQNCLTEEPVEPFTPVDTTILFGEIFDPDHQCRQIYGHRSFYCAGGDKDAEICREMACFNPKLRRCSISAEQRAADGTTCGNYRWCDSGDCVFHTDASPAPESCIYGDYRDPFKPSGLMCAEVIRREPYLCYREDYRTQCCRSCENIKRVNKPGCEYGDHDGSCETLATSHCYEASKRCCEECPKRSTGIGGCEFGDSATWCKGIQAGYRCYGQNSTCCQTCARFKLQNADADCWYGNKVSWCDNIRNHECYKYNTRSNCCGRCKLIANEKDQECKYGDRIERCQVSDCENSGKIRDCCHTCRDHRTIKTNTRDSNCPNAVDTSWCASWLSDNGYGACDTDANVINSCCNECTKKPKTKSNSNCPNAVDTSWCAGWLSDNGYGACDTDAYVINSCCNECTKKPKTKSNSNCANAFDTSWCAGWLSDNGYDACDTDANVINSCCNECTKKP